MNLSREGEREGEQERTSDERVCASVCVFLVGGSGVKMSLGSDLERHEVVCLRKKVRSD
jgi:hypothetical protein